MSRIGKKPVPIPDGVKVSVNGGVLVAEKGKAHLEQPIPAGIRVRVEEEQKQVVVERETDSRQHRALHGLMRALAANMVKGVSEGFEKRLEIVGVGYNAKLQGKTLVLQVGFTHPVNYPIPEGIEIQVPEPTKIVVRGADKQKVGQVAAEIRRIKPPEPYKGKGIRYEGEVIRRKVGKTFVSGQ